MLVPPWSRSSQPPAQRVVCELQVRAPVPSDAGPSHLDSMPNAPIAWRPALRWCPADARA